MPKKGYVQTREHREKTGKAGIGRVPWNKGLRYECQARKGIVPWNKNKKGWLVHTEETKKKMRGRKWTFERRLKQSLERSGENAPNWKDGSSVEPYGFGWNDSLKEQVREDFGRVCVLSLEPENGSKLSIHHVDGNKNNHSLGNLIPLQSWVHMVIHANEKFFEGTIYWKPNKGERG